VILGSCGLPDNNPIVSTAQSAGQDDDIDGKVIKSQALRANGSNQVSTAYIKQQSYSTSKLELPDGYSKYPDKEKHSENQIRKSEKNFYTIDCGKYSEFKKLSDRSEDCIRKYNEFYGQSSEKMMKWNPKTNGIAGEGNWLVVSVSKNQSVIWQDRTTSLLWADIYKENSSWQEASSENGVCDQYNNNNPHGIPSSQISWRLPTRGDFLQADINGARAVLRNTENSFWTSSYIANNQAWSITQSTGVLEKTPITETKAIRCVGVSLQ
jgi:hypothetical protein